MLQAGKRVTVNSDDPSYFPGCMNENLIRVQDEDDSDKAGIVKLAENAFESAWLPRATKERYIAELKVYAG
jgi:adenosine deaminase